MIRTLITCMAVLTSFPAIAATLSSEAHLPAHASTHAHAPAAVWGDDVFLVVWQAGRNEQADIVGARLNKEGKVLDTTPLVICQARDEQARPRVAFGTGQFLVVWQDLRSERDYDVYAARVTPDGKVLDADGFPVTTGEKNQAEPAVCHDGSAYQVVWRHYYGRGYHIHGGRVEAKGKVLDGAGMLLATPPKAYLAPWNMGTPGVFSLGDGCVVAAARSGRWLCLWRIRDGKTDGPVVSDPGGMGTDPAFASDGKHVLMVFTTFMNTGGRSSGRRDSGMLLLPLEGEWVAETSRFGTHFTREGGALAARQLMESGRYVRHPSVAWDGDAYVVAWDVPIRHRRQLPHYDAVFLRRFSSEGKALSEEEEQIAGSPDTPAYRPAVASDGTGTTLVAYERHPDSTDPDVPIVIAFRTLKGT